MERSLARGRQSTVTAESRSASSTDSRGRLPVPSLCSIRERARRSSMIDASRSACLAMMLRNRRWSAGSSPAPSSNVSTKPLIEAIGVLSSCDTLATKSRRTFSSRCMAVTSFKTITAPPSPERSRSAVPRRRIVRSRPPRSRRSSSTGSRQSIARRANRRRSGLRTTSCSGRRMARSESTASSSAAARLIPTTRCRASMASTPSIMLPRTASCWLPCLPIVSPRSTSCSRSEVIASASSASSADSAAGMGALTSPLASRAAAIDRSATGRASRLATARPAANAAAAHTRKPSNSHRRDRANSASESTVSAVTRTMPAGCPTGPMGAATTRMRLPAAAS